MSTRIQGTTGHTVPGVIDRDASPAFTGRHGGVASENVDHARARGQRQTCAFRQTIFAEPERVGTHRAPVILVSAAAIDHFAQRLAGGEPAKIVDPQLGDQLVAAWVQAAHVGKDDDVLRRPQR